MACKEGGLRYSCLVPRHLAPKRSNWRTDLIPRTDLGDFLPARESIRILERDLHVDGNVAPVELDIISYLVKRKTPHHIFEIGTFDGRTTLNMAAQSLPEARIFTLDLPRSSAESTVLPLEVGEELFINKPTSGQRFRGSGFGSKITQLYGDSASFDFTPYFRTVDLVFVDGSHSYDYAVNDTRVALGLLRGGGTVLWHDYVSAGPTPWPGVTRALKELYISHDRFRMLRHIEDTSLVILEVPQDWSEFAVPFIPELIPNSAKSNELKAFLRVDLERTSVSSGSSFKIKVRAVNLGAAVWLPSDSEIGPVRLGTKLLAPTGVCLDDSYWRNHLPNRQAIFPGETIEFDGEVPSPQRGEYILDFDLVADGVAWFNCAGSGGVKECVRVL